MATKPVRHFTNNLAVGEHSRFYRGRAQVARDRVELRADEVSVYRTPPRNPEGVLRGYGGDDGRSEDAEALERLEVGLDTRTTAGIGPGDGEGDRLTQLPPDVTGLGGIDARRRLKVWKFCESWVSPWRMSGS